MTALETKLAVVLFMELHHHIALSQQEGILLKSLAESLQTQLRKEEHDESAAANIQLPVSSP